MEAPRGARVAHTVTPVADPNEHPVISDKTSKLPLILRQHAADKFFEFLTSVKNLPKPEAIQEALQLELTLYNGTKKKNPKPDVSKMTQLRLDEVSSRLEDLLVPQDLLDQINFPCSLKTVRVQRESGQEYECSRCKKPFIPDEYYLLDEPEPCQFHYGRLQNVKNNKSKIYACCNAEVDGSPCTAASRHVYISKALYIDDLLIQTAQFAEMESQLDLVALDGEMCHTESGLELCRLTMVDWDEHRILDVLIKPDSPIIDYNTRFSGLSEESYKDGGFKTVVPECFTPRIFSFSQLSSDLLPSLIGPKTIVVGHSLENDLFHLKLDHKRIIDTSVLYPHNKGQPYRMALRDLSRVHLKQFVQEGSSGHDSYEDCVACLRLLKIKL